MTATMIGCSINSVAPITQDVEGPRPGRTILVYGVAVEGSWPYGRFGIQLDAFDPVEDRSK